MKHCHDVMGETFHGVSLTKPGQALTIEELFRRHVQGLAPSIARSAVDLSVEPGFDSPDMEELERMDLSERGEVLDDLRRSNRDQRAALKEVSDRAKAAAVAPEPAIKGEDELEEDEPVKKPAKKAPKRPSTNNT